MKKACLLFTFNLFFSSCAYATDIVPYLIQSVKSAGSDYVELAGPGSIEVNKVSLPYEGKKYIKMQNIDTLSTVPGNTKACMLAYSSEGYTENISVLKQSCGEILSIISVEK